MSRTEIEPDHREDFNALETGLIILGTADIMANSFSVGIETPMQKAIGIVGGMAIAGIGVVLNKRRERSAQPEAIEQSD